MEFKGLQDWLGINVEGLLLVLGILLGFPILYAASFLEKRSLKLRHIFFGISGWVVAWLCFGKESIWLVLLVISSFIILKVGSSMNYLKTGALLNAVFCFSYLLYAFYTFATDGYDVNVTTPLAVMTMRLIGLGIDVMDGRYNTANKNSISDVPSFIEMFSYCMNIMGLLVGPQFSFRSYNQYMQGEWSLNFKAPCIPESRKEVLRKLCISSVYLALTVVLNSKYPSTLMLSEEFKSAAFSQKLLYVWLCGKSTMIKYFGVWTLQEAVAIYSGFAFNGYSQNGEPLFDGMANVKPFKFETATSLKDIIESFNVNTNVWVKYYVFKRLIFLGNKQASSILSLLFLAVWHGFHSGYLFCFLMEFIFIEAENRLRCRLGSGSLITGWKWYMMKPIQFFITGTVMHYAIASFDLLHWRLYSQVYSGLYYFCHVIAAFIILSDVFMTQRKLSIKPRALSIKSNKID